MVAPVHAASGPAITLSATSATHGTALTLSGSGFAPGAVVTVSVGTTTITGATTIGLQFAGANTLWNGAKPVADADGNFKSAVTVENNVQGTVTVTAKDSITGSSATATFTMNPSVHAVAGSSTSGFPTETRNPHYILYGFGSSDSVTFSSAAFTATYAGCTTGSSSSATPGYCDATQQPMTVATVTGGAKTVTATGSSGLTASATFTVKPFIALYNTQTGVTTFSVAATAPTSLLFEGYGFTGTSIAANNITIGGVSTVHSAITLTNGAFGTSANNHIIVSPSGSLPLGNLAVKVDGTTFNYASGNIKLTGAFTAAAWGAPLISSTSCTGKSCTEVAVLDSANYMPNVGGGTTMALFGYGFDSDAGAGDRAYAIAASAAGEKAWAQAQGTATVADSVDTNGAIFATSTLGEAAYGTYTPTIAGAGAPGNVINPSFGITPWVDLSGTGNLDNTNTITLDYTTSISTGIQNSADCAGACADSNVRVHGFTDGKTVTLSVNGVNLATLSGAVGANGYAAFADNDKFSGATELAGGTYDLVATDSASTPVVATFTGAITIVPLANNNGGGNDALYPATGTQGSVIDVRSGSNFGVHGLAPSTAYDITWGIGGAVIGTFTSSSTGEIPAPGVSVTLPAGTAGLHVLAITTTAGVDALFGNVLADTQGSQPAAGTIGQEGDLWLTFSASVTATPSAANVGTSVTFSGSGLTANTLYVITIDSTAANANCGLAGAAASGQQYGTVTTTSSGSLPATASVTFPSLPTFAGCEKSTLYNVYFSTATEYPGASDGIAKMVLQASASLNSSAVAAGHAVTVTAKGLAAGSAYGIDFNYQLNTAGTAFTSVSLGTIVADATGSGSANIVIPAGTAAGSYVIQLAPPGANDPAKVALVSPPSVSVTQGVVSQLSTSTMTPGTASQTTLQSQQAISLSYTNTYTGSLTIVGYAVVTNALGQVVYYTTASATLSAGQQQTLYYVLAGLPSGSYTVNIYAITSSGTVVSTTTHATAVI